MHKKGFLKKVKGLLSLTRYTLAIRHYKKLKPEIHEAGLLISDAVRKIIMRVIAITIEGIAASGRKVGIPIMPGMPPRKIYLISPKLKAEYAAHLLYNRFLFEAHTKQELENVLLNKYFK